RTVSSAFAAAWSATSIVVSLPVSRTWRLHAAYPSCRALTVTMPSGIPPSAYCPRSFDRVTRESAEPTTPTTAPATGAPVAESRTTPAIVWFCASARPATSARAIEAHTARSAARAAVRCRTRRVTGSIRRHDLGIRIGREAGADEIAVAVRALHPAHGRPELVIAGPRRGEGRALAPVGVRPAVADHARHRMRRVLERVVGAIRDPKFNLSDLLADRDQRVAEPVQLRFRLALRRLDHQRPRHWKAHRRRVEAVVHEPLRDVLDLDPRRRLDRPRIDDALVRHRAVLPAIEHRVVRLEPFRHVIGVEDRHLRRFG